MSRRWRRRGRRLDVDGRPLTHGLEQLQDTFARIPAGKPVTVRWKGHETTDGLDVETMLRLRGFDFERTDEGFDIFGKGGRPFRGQGA